LKQARKQGRCFVVGKEEKIEEKTFQAPKELQVIAEVIERHRGSRRPLESPNFSCRATLQRWRRIPYDNYWMGDS